MIKNGLEIGDKDYTRRKNTIKTVRTIIQIFILIAIVIVIALAMFTWRKYVPYQEQGKNVAIGRDNGFVALSYFGVARTGTSTMISEDRLREHLKAMRKNGYVTITQQDIEDYYNKGKKLPEKSLFLAFEDGRRDTAIFSQKIMEELNYKGTAMTYPEKFELDDTKFLKPDELKSLGENTFWEMGTNGYRLSFINCYDRYDNFLGELSPLKYSHIAPYIGRKYNHYLMDYIRDKHEYPVESYDMMQDRISYDYEKLRDVYTKDLGFVPGAHVLMHSNTGRFGNNKDVSAVNERWITELFKMNFNREGFSVNDRHSNIYDLTRMQPQSYWYTNHLLMRVYYDQKVRLEFQRGRLEDARQWNIVCGEPEFKDEKIILTTLPEQNSLIKLKNMKPTKNIHAAVRMTGNKVGSQTLYLRVKDNVKDAIALTLSGNYLFVSEKGQEMAKIDLQKLDGVKPVSVDEDRKAAEVTTLENFARYASTPTQAEAYAQRARQRNEMAAKSVAEGAKEYVPEISINEQGNRLIEAFLKDNILQIKVDGKLINTSWMLSNQDAGVVALEASWKHTGWSQRNLTDDVYDGVFEKFMVYAYDGTMRDNTLVNFELAGQKFHFANPLAKGEPVIFSGCLEGWDGFVYDLKDNWEKLLGLFITAF